MTELFAFHQYKGLSYAFLGVHIVGVAADSGRWMSALDGNITWRRGGGEGGLDAAKAALTAHILDWYEAAHQPLKPGQADRLCEHPYTLRPKREVRINPIDLEAVAVRVRQAGVVTTYVMPPVAEGIEAPQATILSMRAWCVSAHATAEAKLRAMPADRLTEHELGVFAGMLRLIDACRTSTLISDELRRIAAERAEAARAAEPDLSAEASAQTDQDGAESTRVDDGAETDHAEARA